MSSKLAIRLLGGLEITLAGQVLDTFMSNKAPALLIYLALTPRSQPRDLLATLLWGEMGDADAKNNLRQVLTNLRKVLDPYLLVTRESIGFNHTAAYFLDVLAFEQYLHAGRSPAGSPLEEEQAEQLQQAVALYQGDFLAGFTVRDAPAFEEWLLAQRARLRELALHALHQLTEWRLARGHYSQVIDSASQSLRIEPWREEAHRHLMIALARSGQRSAALAQYRHCAQLLQHELGVEPAAATRQLYQRIRAAGEALPHNLPPQPTSFVGRWVELQRLETKLRQADCRLLTLVGVGGTGKTRLALAAADRLLQSGAFLNGVFFVPLVALDSPELLATAIAEACGLTFAGNKSPQQQVLDFLRNQEILLLLDNFEQILAAAAWLGELLSQAPGVKFLVTSRTRLHLRWEQLEPVEGLELLAAVQLFAERARLVEPTFVATGVAAVQQICQLVQGLPLAIELAAASVLHYSCPQIAASLAQTLDLLTSQLRDLPDRHRSVRAAFDYSWRQLNAAEQQLLLALAVFHGTFTEAAVAALCAETTRSLNLSKGTGDELVQPLLVSRHPPLAALIDKSLLRRNLDGRLQLHELIRQYAAERLAFNPAWQTTVQRRHAEYYANLVAQQSASISGPTQRQSLARLEEELDNIRAAWNWAGQQRAAALLAAMIDPLFEFYEVRSLVQEAAERFGLALQALQQNPGASTSEPALLVKLLNRQARFLARLGKRSEAKALLQQSSALAQANGLLRESGLAFNYRGLLAQAAGDYLAAQELYHASLECCTQAEDQTGLARALNNLGVINLWLGNLNAAEHHLQEALHLRRQLGNPKAMADSLNNLGILLHEKTEYMREAELLHEALANYRQLEDLKGIGTILHNLGGVHLALHEYDAARSYLEEALVYYRRTSPADLGSTLNNLGTVAMRAGDLATAAIHYGDALLVTSQNEDVPMTLDILVGIAEVLLLQKQSGIALTLLTTVLALGQDSDTRAEAERLLALAPNSPPTVLANTPQTLEQAVALALRSLVN